MNNDIALEKKLTPLGVWALAFGCIIGFGAFILPGTCFLKNAGPLGTGIAMVIAAIVMIIIACNYHYMVNKFPVAGGEFNYAQNTFGEKHGFVCSWFLGLSYATLVPMNATALAVIARNLLGDFFQTGFHYIIYGYDVYLGELGLAIGAIIFFSILSIRGVSLAATFQIVLTFTLILGVVIIACAAVFNDDTSIISLSPGFYPSYDNSWVGILSVLAVCPFAFVGFDTVPQSAEEFKFSQKKAIKIMAVAILFGALVYIILNTVTVSIYPPNYSNWVEYIDDLPNLTGLESLPTFYVAKKLMGTVGLIFIGLAVISATLSGIVGFYMATTRLLYSMSNNKVIPLWFGVLHNKYRTPSNAILFLMSLSLIAPFFGRTALGWLVDMSSVGAAIGYGYTSAAALFLAKNDKNYRYIITGVFGLIMSVIFAILLLVPIPGLNCSLGSESYLCLLLWIVLGIIFYVKR